MCNDIALAAVILHRRVRPVVVGARLSDSQQGWGRGRAANWREKRQEPFTPPAFPSTACSKGSQQGLAKDTAGAASKAPETARGCHCSLVPTGTQHLCDTHSPDPQMGVTVPRTWWYSANGDGSSQLHLNTILEATLSLVQPVWPQWPPAYTGECWARCALGGRWPWGIPARDHLVFLNRGVC